MRALLRRRRCVDRGRGEERDDRVATRDGSALSVHSKQRVYGAPGVGAAHRPAVVPEHGWGEHIERTAAVHPQPAGASSGEHVMPERVPVRGMMRRRHARGVQHAECMRPVLKTLGLERRGELSKIVQRRERDEKPMRLLGCKAEQNTRSTPSERPRVENRVCDSRHVEQVVSRWVPELRRMVLRLSFAPE